MSKILIFAEQRGGTLHPAVPQLMTAARHFDAACEVEVCVVGQGLDGVVSDIGQYGPARVWSVDDTAFGLYRAQPYATALSTVIQQSSPDVVLLAATSMGRDLAPRIGARLGAAVATDCIDGKLDGEQLDVVRPVYMGKATAAVRLAAGRLKVVSIRPNTFAAASAGQISAEVHAVTVRIPEPEQGLVNEECVSTSSGVKDVTEADIVVSGGRSLKSEDHFGMLYELAQTLDGAVGASRAACDAGYQPHSRQVGLTGKTVTPKLYMAFGIDGAIQHLAGMRGSKVIAAINTKKEAPIFGVATYGCVADLFDMVPLLNAEFKKVLGG
jgi:electron transfer flavoprotein alpha subunit